MKSITLLASIFSALLFVGCSDSSTAVPKHSKALFQTVPAKKATLVQKGKYKESCVICGMNLPTFYKTNHTAEMKKTGNKRQYCSLHCVVDDNQNNKTDLKDLKVVDTNSLKFISVYKAFYVVGSSKPGTMSRTSKYAFAKKSDAKAFAKEFGGKVMNFNDTYTEAMKDSYK